MSAAAADIALLRAAIDAGDDSALPALADLLEEAGDPRAAGLRRPLLRRKRPAPFLACGPGRPEAVWSVKRREGGESFLAQRTFRRLKGAMTRGEFAAVAPGVWPSDGSHVYASRSAALLALAEALSAGPAGVRP